MFTLKTYGQSMAPFFLDGDILTIKKVPFSNLKINDFITIKNGGQFITHRVIYKPDHGKYLITKGDNNLKTDGKISPSDIIGKVEEIKRKNQTIATENLYLFQSTLYFDEIVKVKEALEKKNIDFVFLKGLPLHLFFEKVHPRRIYADCDLLVSSVDYEKLAFVLRSLGYRTEYSSYSKIHTLLKDKQTEVSFSKKVRGFPILFDIHLEPVFMMNQLGKLNALYSQKYIDEMTNDFFRTKKVINIYKKDFPILSNENLIIYLALHIFHHNFKGYYRYQFLETILNNTKSDFDKIAEMINHYKLANFVYPVFSLLKKYYLAKLPPHFLEAIKPKNSAYAYIKKNINNLSIFDDELRIKAGTDRFKNIFFLSPNPLFIRLLVFLNPAVLYSLFWVILRRSKNLFL